VQATYKFGDSSKAPTAAAYKGIAEMIAGLRLIIVKVPNLAIGKRLADLHVLVEQLAGEQQLRRVAPTPQSVK